MIIKIERKNNQTLLIWCPINKSKQKFQTLLMSRDSITRSNRWPTSFVSLKRTKRKTNLLIAKLERPSQWKTWSLSCWLICLFFLFKQATRPFSIWDCTFSKEWYDLFFFLYFSCFFLILFEFWMRRWRSTRAGRRRRVACSTRPKKNWRDWSSATTSYRSSSLSVSRSGTRSFETARKVNFLEHLSSNETEKIPFWNKFCETKQKGSLSGTPFVKWNVNDHVLEQVLWNQTKMFPFWNTSSNETNTISSLEHVS